MKKRIYRMVIFSLFFFSCGNITGQTSFHGLVVLIDFSDQPANVSVSRANNIINGIGYTEATVTSSLRDYWYRQSRGKVIITHDVIGYYRAPQPAAWYNSQPFPEYKILIKDALNWVVANNPGYNWNALSLANGPMNRNGTEEGTFLSISFMTTAWIPGTGGTHHFLQDWTAPNGVHPKQVVGATFMAPWDTNINLFWLTHEEGHMIWGWPDTYDNTAQSHGTGIYSVMSGNQSTGDIEPVGGPFLAAENWVNIIDINTQSIVLTEDGNTVARYRNPSEPMESFIIEARMKSTIGNAAFPAERGLLIWHVDDRVTTSNIYPQMTPAQHYRISVEQADGLFHLEGNINAGDAGDIYVPGKSFNDLVIPNSNWWNGSPSTLSISNIQFLPGNKISFNASSQICSAGNGGNQKVNVCHNNTTICIVQNAVAAHLAHGDYLGPCIGTIANRGDLPGEESLKTGFDIFPIPNKGNFIATLNFPVGQAKNGVIQIINSSGQVIKQVNVNEQHTININLKESGVYFIRLITNKQVLMKKLVVIQ